MKALQKKGHSCLLTDSGGSFPDGPGEGRPRGNTFKCQESIRGFIWLDVGYVMRWVRNGPEKYRVSDQ